MGNKTAGSDWQLAKARYEYSEPGGPALGDRASRVALLTELAGRLDYPEREDALGEVAQTFAHAGMVEECLKALDGVESNQDEDEVNFTGYAHIAPIHWSKAAEGLARAGCGEAAAQVAARCAPWVENAWDSAERSARDRLEQVRVMTGMEEHPEGDNGPELLAEGGHESRAIALAMKSESIELRTLQFAQVARMLARAGNRKGATERVYQALDFARINMSRKTQPDAEPAAWAIGSALARLGQIDESLDWLHECLNREWISWNSFRKPSLVADAAASGNPAALDLVKLLSPQQLRDASIKVVSAFAECGNVEAARDVAMRALRAATNLRSYGDENVDVCCALAIAGSIDWAEEAWKDTRELRNTGMFSIRNHTYFQGHLAAAWVLKGELDKALTIAEEEKNSSLWSVDPVAYISRALILGRAMLAAR